MARLQLRSLEKSYGKVPVVRGIDLALDEGDFVSLLGPSGCGKTTTLRMIAGFLPPTAGTIEMDGKVLSSAQGVVPPERRQMSMIFQSYAIWPHMTIEENVAFGLKLRNLPAAELRRRVGEMLEIVRLDALAKRYPSELSGGQQQRVALARALVIKPSVLLLDEPLSNLDAHLREEMRLEIRRLHNEFKITTVYVTHDQAEAMSTSDRIAVMNGGVIEQVDAPHVLYTRPKTTFVASFIGRTNLLAAQFSNGEIGFAGWALKADRMAGQALRTTGSGMVSIRPQAIRLHPANGSAMADAFLPATILDRVYLGESWDYTVAPHSGEARIRVSAPPLDILEVGDKVWLELDTRQMAIVG